MDLSQDRRPQTRSPIVLPIGLSRVQSFTCKTEVFRSSSEHPESRVPNFKNISSYILLSLCAELVFANSKLIFYSFEIKAV